MRALHSVPALALPAVALLVVTACSLLAPTNAELMGDTAPSMAPVETPGIGGYSANDSSANELGGGSEGGDRPGNSPCLPLGGDGQLPASSGGAGGSPDLPVLIPQDRLALWLMADHGIGAVEDGGVAVWADQSLNEADAKQSITSLRPSVVEAADGVPQMLEFDGVDDQLALPEGFGDFKAGLSIFVVASESTDQSCPSLLHLSNAPEEQDIEVGRFHGSVHYEVGDDDVWGPENAFGLNQNLLLGVVHAPGKAPELRLNGVFMAMGGFTALPVVASRSNNFIGRSLYNGCEAFHGKIGEIIVYARALTSTERDAVQRYLQSKWGYEPPVKTKPGPGEIPYLQ